MCRTAVLLWAVLSLPGLWDRPADCVGVARGQTNAVDSEQIQDKVSDVIVAHQADKMEEIRKMSRGEISILSVSEESLQRLTTEECAYYVDRPLTDSEITKLADDGIMIHDTYVPPVPGRHPQGFYLATVPYDRLDAVAADARCLRLVSAELPAEPANDRAATLTRVDRLYAGQLGLRRTGAGVRIAIADDGLDVDHRDIPTPLEAFDVTTGADTATWSRQVGNPLSSHGTHVTASALGRGTCSGGRYRGAAPGADLCFYKIAAGLIAWDYDEIEAIQRAGKIGCDIFSMSFGGIDTFMDGSSPVCQAIDAAVAGGMMCFISAGNEQNAGRHYSWYVAPGQTVSLRLRVNNRSGETYAGDERIRVIWRDGNSSDRNVQLSPASGASLTWKYSAGSVRGTEAVEYALRPSVPTGSTRDYTLVVTNTAAFGQTPQVHLYLVSGVTSGVSVYFDPNDPRFTVKHPAIADGAIAVGAWTHRKSWTDYEWKGYQYLDLQEGTLAPFSSLGPRIDGQMKPDLVAPGAAMISARASWYWPSYCVIDNDGVWGGDANYYVSRGTSMACPYAAGIAALVLEAAPSLSPAELRYALTSTASQAGNPDNKEGYGLIDAWAAVQCAVSMATTTNE